MGLHLWDRWRERHGVPSAREAPLHPGDLDELLSECALLREQAGAAGVLLDDTPDSLHRLDQLLPRWHEDPERESWLGNDAGLYLGTVIVRTVRGSTWQLARDGSPMVRLPSGREVEVLAIGSSWAAEGAPELGAVYAEIDED
jgi:hypothetical protein